MNHGLEVLNDREKTHGSFNRNSYISQTIKSFLKEQDGWHSLHPEHKEVLDMIALKISRILGGQSNFYDHWKDIAGYAKLAEEACPPPPSQTHQEI